MATPDLEDKPCPLGCVRDDEPILKGSDLLHNIPGEFMVVRCRACKLMRTNPRPSEEQIGRYYPDDYGPYIGSQVRVEGKPHKHFAALRRIIKRAISFELKTEYLPPLPPGRMLEIGCASGSFLHRMAKQGWCVDGIEFSSKAAAAARALGYNVHAGSVERAPLPGTAYDLIVGWMVLEHLHSPVSALRKLYDSAKPGAALAISVPNCGNWQFRLFRNKWYALQLPNHLYHFTPENIRAVLSKGGWKLTHIHFQRVLTDPICSIGHVLSSNGFSRLGDLLIRIPDRQPRLLNLLYPLAALLSVWGKTGRMTVWAEKDDRGN